MISLEHYLNDDSCWQSQAVLAYLRGNIWRLTDEKYDNKDINVYVGRYENCREQGYVFTLSFWCKKDGLNKQIRRSYAVYQHRNTDTLCVLISNVFTINTPGIDDMWKEKGENPRSSQYDKGFNYDDIKGCAEWIMNDMDSTINKYELLDK